MTAFFASCVCRERSRCAISNFAYSKRIPFPRAGRAPFDAATSFVCGVKRRRQNVASTERPFDGRGRFVATCRLRDAHSFQMESFT